MSLSITYGLFGKEKWFNGHIKHQEKDTDVDEHEAESLLNIILKLDLVHRAQKSLRKDLSNSDLRDQKFRRPFWDSHET